MDLNTLPTGLDQNDRTQVLSAFQTCLELFSFPLTLKIKAIRYRVSFKQRIVFLLSLDGQFETLRNFIDRRHFEVICLQYEIVIKRSV